MADNDESIASGTLFPLLPDYDFVRFDKFVEMTIEHQ